MNECNSSKVFCGSEQLIVDTVNGGSLNGHGDMIDKTGGDQEYAGGKVIPTQQYHGLGGSSLGNVLSNSGNDHADLYLIDGMEENSKYSNDDNSENDGSSSDGGGEGGGGDDGGDGGGGGA